MTIRQRQFLRKPNCTDCSTQQRGGLREVPKAKNEKSNARKLHCSVCEAFFDFNPSGHITVDIREHHFSNRKDRVVCYKCHEKGKVLVREDQQRLKARKLMCSECKKPFDFDSHSHRVSINSGPDILVQRFEPGVLSDLRACLKIPSYGSLSALPVRRRRSLGGVRVIHALHLTKCVKR